MSLYLCEQWRIDGQKAIPHSGTQCGTHGSGDHTGLPLTRGWIAEQSSCLTVLLSVFRIARCHNRRTTVNATVYAV